ncbi:MAG: universal stress protein [Terracidiphilus sp.]
MYRHILIGLDQSLSAHRALVRAIELASRFGATLTAMAIVPAPPPQAAYAAAISSEALQIINGDEQDSFVELLQRARSEGAQRAVEVETVLSDGPVVSSLTNAVRKHHIDLLVMGIHPELTPFGWFTASTAHELAVKATCDVLGVH